MFKNREIIECAKIVHALNAEKYEFLPENFHREFFGGGETGIPPFVLLLNYIENKYVIWVKETNSNLRKDFENFISSNDGTTEFYDGYCDSSSYSSARKIIEIVQYELKDQRINRLFCVGFADGGSIASVIATILQKGNNSLIKQNLERFKKGGIYGIIFGSPSTFSTRINIETQQFILNFILINDYAIKQKGLDSKVPLISMIQSMQNGINSNRLPGNVIPLNPSACIEKGFINGLCNVLKYMGILKSPFNPYLNTIIKTIHDDENTFDDVEFKLHMLESCAIYNETKKQNDQMQYQDKSPKKTNQSKQKNNNSNVMHKQQKGVQSQSDCMINIKQSSKYTKNDKSQIINEKEKQEKIVKKDKKLKTNENNKSNTSVESPNLKSKQNDKSNESIESPNLESKQNDKSNESTESPNLESKQNNKSNESIESPNLESKQNDKSNESIESPNLESKQNDKSNESIESPNLKSKQNDKSNESIESPNLESKQNDKSNELIESPNLESKQNDKFNESIESSNLEPKENEELIQLQIQSEPKNTEQTNNEAKTEQESSYEKENQSNQKLFLSKCDKSTSTQENKSKANIHLIISQSSIIEFAIQEPVSDIETEQNRIKQESLTQDNCYSQIINEYQINDSSKKDPFNDSVKSCETVSSIQSEPLNCSEIKQQIKCYNTQPEIKTQLPNPTHKSIHTKQEQLTPNNTKAKKRTIHANTIQLGTIKINHEIIDEQPRSKSALAKTRNNRFKSNKIVDLSPKFHSRRNLIQHSRIPLYDTYKYFQQ